MCPKVIDTCPSSMRHHTAAAVPSRTPREVTICTHTFRRRVPLSMALLVLSHWPFSATELGAQAQRERAPSRLETTVDTTIKPGDDFFAYANGAWLNATAIPPGRDRWTVRDEINERTRLQIA